jgi:1-acyl-sn-glycerol-3-phosphate acyltransferase
VGAALLSLLHWLAAGLFFLAAAPGLALLWACVDSSRTDRLTRLFCRTLTRLAGARVEVVLQEGWDPGRAGFFCPNHVNMLDPFVLYPALPVHVVALELESHFAIPLYGTMMRNFGMIPVPAAKTASGVRRLWQSVEKALGGGSRLIVFPEGSRTRDGKLRPFKDGVFRMARRFGAPITPVTISGAFRWNNKLSWLLRPSRVLVTVHPAIEPGGLTDEELSERVRAAIQSALPAENRG